MIKTEFDKRGHAVMSTMNNVLSARVKRGAELSMCQSVKKEKRKLKRFLISKGKKGGKERKREGRVIMQ